MKDRAVAIVSLAAAAGYYTLAAAIPASDLTDGTGPAGLPITYAALLALLSVILFVQSFIGSRPIAGSGPGDARETHGTWSWRPVATLGVGIGYVALVPVLGYVPALTALIATATVTNGGRMNLRTVGVAVGGALALWVLFVWFLGIQQPEGWWPVPAEPAETASL